MVQAIGQVLVIIDEGDRAFGSGGDGDGDGGTSSRVIARIKEFMSDTSNRGRILFILMTNRPDKLDIDIKRAGRLDKKIPLLYAQTAEEVEAVRAGAAAQAPAAERGSSSPPTARRCRSRSLGMSNADFEAIVLLAAEIAAGADAGAQTIRVGARPHGAGDRRLPAVARRRRCWSTWSCWRCSRPPTARCCPRNTQTMSAEELQARLEILRLECGNRR